MNTSTTEKSQIKRSSAMFLLAGCFASPLFAADEPAPVPPAPAPTVAPAAPAAPALPRHHNMKDAYAAALKQRKPVLLVIGATWCGPCKVLEKEMASPDAAAALDKVVLVHLDADTAPEAQALLHSGAIPLLRILSPTGQRIDMKEGVMKAADLSRWIEERQEQAMEVADDLLETGEPGAFAMPKLIKRLGDSDAAFREAAIKRLLPFPHIASVEVVTAFDKGPLATRLSCLELLTEWKAPIASVDPWRPDTITADRIKALVEWSNRSDLKPAAPGAVVASQPAQLTPEQFAEAKLDIARMLAAPNIEDARAIRDRLARLKQLKPIVIEELAKATTDGARERLLALRYRLAASEPLMIAWPGGIERLAATDAKSRHAAAEQLIARAGDGDGDLLLELFSDPDPFVREISLRGLRSVGKGDAAKALVGLLGDPDANVRAAVLKQLAETASPAFLPAVIAYVQKEKDADLIVHAIRVLRVSKGTLAIEGLTKLLTHESWRVRAEAAEGLAEFVKGYDDFATSNKASIYVSMIGLLEDPDNFVVSRAAQVLRGADTPLVIEPMAKAADKYPELAADLIPGMVQRGQAQATSEKHLRAFCLHKDERLRAEAITALVGISKEIERELTALLKDPSLVVRVRAAEALFSVMNSARPGNVDDFDPFSRLQEAPAKAIDLTEWAAKYREGTGRADWMATLLPELEKLSQEKEPAHQLAGALPMLALAPVDKAYPLIVAAVSAEPGLASDAAGSLPWLPLKERVALFNLLVPAAGDQPWQVVNSMAIIRDMTTADAMWDLLASEKATAQLAGSMSYGLRQIYLGDRYYGDDELPAAQKNAAITHITNRARGTEIQSLLAMALLSAFAADESAALAEKIQADPKSSPQLKAEAFQVRLLTLPPAASARLAAESIKGPDNSLQSTALEFLAMGAQNLIYLREDISITHHRVIDDRIQSGRPLVFPPPAHLTADQIEAAFKRASTGSADGAHAGYLLALHGRRDGLNVLIAQWRLDSDEELLRRNVVRAIAMLDASDQIGILETIYEDLRKDPYEIREFYWTIRGMTGEKALLLRKKIRDEIGMEHLK